MKNRLGDLLAYTSGYELLVVCDQRRCCFKVDLGRGEVHTFAQAGEGDGIGIVSFLSESTGDSLPTPAAEPTTTDQHVSGHPKDLLLRQRPSSNDSTLAVRCGNSIGAQGWWAAIDPSSERRFGEGVFPKVPPAQRGRGEASS